MKISLFRFKSHQKCTDSIGKDFKGDGSQALWETLPGEAKVSRGPFALCSGGFTVDVSTATWESMSRVTLREVMLICHPRVKHKLIKL